MTEDDHNIIDYEEVLRVLPDAFRESWKNNPDVLVYLSDLGSLGLQRLGQEPERLAEERNTVLEQTQDLAFHNYKTFIQAAECSHTIFKDFNIIESRLDHLLNKLPDFKFKCGEFGKEAQLINSRWRQASSTLAKHPQLLEFLEIPQLMDNCVRDGLYDEALELSSYVKRLERKNFDIPLVKSIINDVQVTYNLMLTNLLSKLETNIQLPECLKIVGYLRRMDVFNELELRIKFLQSRDSWFQKVINDIPKQDPYEHVTKVIENSRIHLFDIITQFRAIFSDDDPLVFAKEDSKNNCAIFHSWMTYKISWFLSVLKKDLSANFTGKIDSLLTQCMYFGLSFSRVNIDFRPLLVQIFENAAFHQFNIALKKAIYNFEGNMRTYTFSTYASPTFATFSEESLQPPISLLDFYPLAQYYNDILSALNELKLCCSYSISSNVLSALTTSLKQVVKILVTIHAKKNRTMTEAENENFNRLCLLFSTDLTSHLNKCLNAIFPPDDISQILGLTSIELTKIEHLCKLDFENILLPLQDILPARDEDLGLIMTMKSNLTSSEETQVVSLSNEDKKEQMQNLTAHENANNQKLITSVEVNKDLEENNITTQTSNVDVSDQSKEELSSTLPDVVKETEPLVDQKLTESFTQNESIENQVEENDILNKSGNKQSGESDASLSQEIINEKEISERSQSSINVPNDNDIADSNSHLRDS